MKLSESAILQEIDPHFQRLLERRQRGLTSPATASTNAGEIAVMARVSDVATWEEMSEVEIGAMIGPSGDGSWLVTGRIPVSRIEAVRQADVVISLKPARRLRTTLEATVEEVHAREDLLPDAAQGELGKGVIVGIVDYGCDFQHADFRNPDGSSRILKIWHQRGRSSPRSPFGYGKLYSQEAINRALQTSDPYLTLGYGPSADPNGTHGTHVMGIAAGNGAGSELPGTAPNADIIFVHPDNSDVPWSGAEAVGADFGDSVRLLEAIKFIFDEAGDQPCVINISLGTNGGAHDGSSLVEQGIDSLVSSQPNRAVVIAASNSYDDGIHAAGRVVEGEHTDLSWNVSDQDATDNELEIWYPSGDEFRLELIAPDGRSLGFVNLGKSGEISDDNGRILLFISHRASDPNNGDNTIGLFMEDRLPSGTWTLRLHGIKVDDGQFHSWIERDDRGQSSFSPPHDNTHTIGSISTGQLSIVAGSYDAHKSSVPLSWFSSAGPTRDGREKPEISAPGHAVWSACSGSGDGVVRKSGTSMAAPAVTGIIALLFAEAKAFGIDLSIEKLREILGNSARSPDDVDWDDRYGQGRIDASAAVEAVIQLAAERNDGN